MIGRTAPNDPDTAIKTAGFEATVVPPTKEAVMKVIGL